MRIKNKAHVPLFYLLRDVYGQIQGVTPCVDKGIKERVK
jgi:hypothetical protein